jgi:ribosome-associated heat shock protein Hsp15
MTRPPPRPPPPPPPPRGPANEEPPAASGDAQGWQRLDVWLWCARFLRSRADCARLVATGVVRLNRQPTDKPHARVRVGDVLTLGVQGTVRVVQVRGLARRRGPAAEARLLYDEIPEPGYDAPDDPVG